MAKSALEKQLEKQRKLNAKTNFQKFSHGLILIQHNSQRISIGS